MQDLTRDTISENLSKRLVPQPAVTLPVISAPVKPILSPAEVRKNEILATLGCLQPLPAKPAEMTFVQNLSSSVDIFVKPATSSVAAAVVEAATSVAAATSVSLTVPSSSSSPTSKALRSQHYKTFLYFLTDAVAK
jgi:hypothetical protein